MVSTVLAGALLVACSSSAVPHRRHGETARSGSPSGSRGPTAPERAAVPLRHVLRAAFEPWQLPRAVSREAVLAVRARLEVVGGLAPGDATTAGVGVVDPATGRYVAARPLARASHDAAGAVVAGRPMVFGGGSTASQNWIQRQADGGAWQVVGTLPTVRSDLAAVTVRGRGYVLGGYDGVRLSPSVLRMPAEGRPVGVGRLPVPVRYAAVATTGHDIWVIGGLAQSGPTNVVQRFDVTTGHAAVVGRLPVRLQGGVAVALAGRVYVCGGVVDHAPTAQVFGVDPVTGRIARAGRLPGRVSYAGAAVLGGSAYVVGGETPAPTAKVIRLHLVSRSKRGRS